MAPNLVSLPRQMFPSHSLGRFTHTRLCAPLLVVFLLIFLMITYPSKSHDHDSKFRPCKRLHAIFTKAGLEPPLPPSSPTKWHPVFRIHITPAPPGLSRSKTGSVHGRRHRHRSNKYRLPGPDFEKVMEDIWESPRGGTGVGAVDLIIFFNVSCHCRSFRIDSAL
jgi:hypothetical protein